MRELARADIRALLQQLVDVVVQSGRDPRGHRIASEIWYRDGGAGVCATRHMNVPAESSVPA